MEGLGKKLQEARLARNLTIDEAARITKIRPARLQEIENEDFSEFSSLAYAKGFLLIYGKFLNVDVSPYLEAFEASDSVTVDGYQYLQDNPAPRPSRPAVTRRPRPTTPRNIGGSGRGSFLPFFIGVIVLVVGFVGMKWILEIQRLKPGPPPPAAAISPTPAAPTEKVVAPHAVLVEEAPTPSPAAVMQPSPVPPSPAPQPTIAEPEVRRAEPVRPEDAVKVKPTAPVVRKPIQVRSPIPNLPQRPYPTPRTFPNQPRP